MSNWDDFYARHRGRNYTPAFNAYLESQIEKPKLPLEVRVGAWILRTGWGNHSESCINAEGVIQTQTDCARDLKLFDKKGEPDRRRVNPVFRAYAKGNYIRFSGQEIILIDDPEGKLQSSPNIPPQPDPFSTDREEEEKSFHHFLEHVWASNHPDEFRELQQIERRQKEIRTAILTQWKTYRQTSERVRQNGCPKGSDSASERVRQPDGEGPTMPDPSLLLKTENGKGIYNGAPPPATNGDNREWRRFRFAAEHAGLTFGEGELESLERTFNSLSPAERENAIEGIDLRVRIGQYPHYPPRLKRYLDHKLWTERPRPQTRAKAKAAANSAYAYIDRIIAGEEGEA